MSDKPLLGGTARRWWRPAAATAAATGTIVAAAIGGLARRPALLSLSEQAQPLWGPSHDAGAMRRAQLIAMADRAVRPVVLPIQEDEAERLRQGTARVTGGGVGFRGANTPQLEASGAAATSVVGGRRLVTSQLSAIDSFFDSDQNKMLVAQAMEEEALEAENGGQGEGSDLMPANALSRLESGDTEFENEWANAGEKVAATASARQAAHSAYKYMIERDLGHAREEFNAAKAEADAEGEKLEQEQAALASAEQAVLDAQHAAADADAALTSADEQVAAAEAAATAEAAEQSTLASCEAYQTALASAGTAGESYTDAIETVVDATGDSSTTLDDVAAVGQAAEDVAGSEAAVAAARASCLVDAGLPSEEETDAAAAAAGSVEEAMAAKAAANAAKTAADQAVAQKEAAKAVQEEAVAAQQAIYEEKLAVQEGKQAIMDHMLAAHKALACNPKKLEAVEPYTIEMQEAGACDFPSDASRVKYAVTQAQKAAAEATHRATLSHDLAGKAWWQEAWEELGDSAPAIDKAQAAWDEAIAMKEAEAV